MNLPFSLLVHLGFGCEESPLRHEGFGCLGRLGVQVMKCLFMVMSLNPALLISAADLTRLRQGRGKRAVHMLSVRIVLSVGL